MDDSKVHLGRVGGTDQDLGLSVCRIKPRGFKVGTKKVNRRNFSKFVSCSCHQKGYRQPSTTSSASSSDQDYNPSIPSTPSSDHPGKNPSNPCHAIFIFLDPLLLAVLQVEYQNKKESPFDTHPIQKQTFLVAICIYSALLGIMFQNTLARCGFLDQILSFVLLVSGSVSSGALLSILLHGVLLWLVLIILGSIPIILGRHLLKNSVHWILGWVAKLDLKSKFSTMSSIFHGKAPAQASNIKHTDRVEGI